MKLILSENLQELETINEKIHQWMIVNIPHYTAIQWSVIYKHPTKELYALDVGDDTRNPISALTLSQKSKLTETLDRDWYETEKSITPEGKKPVLKRVL